MRVFASGKALRIVRQHGGRLYLWQEPFTNDWLTDHFGFEDPNRGSAFVEHDLEGEFRVLIERGLEPPRELRLAASLLNRHKLKILWDGQRWGWRGEAVDVGG